jgi:queuosine precursor transporter
LRGERIDATRLANGTAPEGGEIAMSAIILVGAYVAAQMLSDVASLKVASVFGLPVDAGTFIYPVTFTLRDLVHKRLGKKAARITIVLAGAINLAMALYFWAVSLLPSHASWDAELAPGLSMGRAYSAILSPAWIVVAASILAEVASELVDTEAYRFWERRMGERLQWMRVLFSNAFSVPLDSLIFCWIAGLWAWRMEPEYIWANVGFNVAVKFAVTLLSLPAIYLVRQGRREERS